MDQTTLRIIILAVGLVFMAALYLLSRRGKPDQGKRSGPGPAPAKPREGGRVEPTLSEILARDVQQQAGEGEDIAIRAGDPRVEAQIDLLERTLAGETAKPVPPPPQELGVRPNAEFDKIVTLYLAARAGSVLRGPDLVVAAEKAGLVYGHMGVFHRLVDNHPEQGPVFSVANLVKPGSFDLANIHELQTPGISFFMTLPAPINALDAWDMMLPAAQRMAELLDAVVLDEERNAIGRQRIAHLRDELRAYDRRNEAQTIRPGW